MSYAEQSPTLRPMSQQATSLDSPEAPVVAQLTDSRLFSYSFQQSQDLSAFLILSKRRQAAQ